MLVFAAVHGALFMGDIIGAYALIAVVLAGPIAGRGRRTQAVVGVLSTAVCLGYMLYIGWFLSVGGVTWAVTTASLAAWFSGSRPDWRTRTSSSPASPSGVRRQSLLWTGRAAVMMTPSTAAVQAPVSIVTCHVWNGW